MKGNKGLESICSEEGCSEHTTGRYENYSCLGRLERERGREEGKGEGGQRSFSSQKPLAVRFRWACLSVFFSLSLPKGCPTTRSLPAVLSWFQPQDTANELFRDSSGWQPIWSKPAFDLSDNMNNSSKKKIHFLLFPLVGPAPPLPHPAPHNKHAQMEREPNSLRYSRQEEEDNNTIQFKKWGRVILYHS